MGVSSSLVLGLSGSCEVMVFLSRFSMLLVLRRLLSVEVFLLRFYSRFLFLMVIGKAVANVGREGSRFLIRLRILLVLMLLSDTEGSLSGSEGSCSSCHGSLCSWFSEGYRQAIGFYSRFSVAHVNREGYC